VWKKKKKLNPSKSDSP